MIWFLLVLYQMKHFVCDYPLQGKYMLGKFKGGYDWVLPLTAHAGVHGLATLLIVFFIKPELCLYLAAFDIVVHFTMDRIKASPNMLGRYKALSANEFKAIMRLQAEQPEAYEKFKPGFTAQFKENTYFWWALGLDQGVHHLTHYAIIYFLVR